MRKIRNLKVVTAGLCLGVTLLTGCNENSVKIGNSKIIYDNENDKVEGSITFEDLNKYAKVVSLEENDETFYRLLLKIQGVNSDRVYGEYEYNRYIDLETGATLIAFNDFQRNGKREWIMGSNLNVITESGIISYLANNDYVKTNYTVDELISFFEENVISTLKSDEKELVK